MIADEIQSGLGRTGYTFACAAEGVVPDAYLLGKALGGGIVPVSAMVSTWPVLGVLHPGQHGSTFGGNPLACAVGREVVAMLRTGEYQARATVLGERMHARLAALPSSGVSTVRGRGLWAGLEFASLPGREVCERLAARGVLAKETHGNVIRLAPPLIISQDDLDWGLDRIEDAIRAVARVASVFGGAEAAVAAGVVDRAAPGAGGPGAAPRAGGSAGPSTRDHPADDDAVVAAVVDGEGLAFQRGQRAVEQRRAGDRARVVRQLVELAFQRAAPGGQPARGLLRRPRPGWTPPRRRPPARRRGSGRSSRRRTARAAARARPTRTR